MSTGVDVASALWLIVASVKECSTLNLTETDLMLFSSTDNIRRSSRNRPDQTATQRYYIWHVSPDTFVSVNFAHACVTADRTAHNWSTSMGYSGATMRRTPSPLQPVNSFPHAPFYWNLRVDRRFNCSLVSIA